MREIDTIDRAYYTVADGDGQGLCEQFYADEGRPGLVLPETPPDHSTISRTRRVIDLETHAAVSPGCCSDSPTRACCRVPIAIGDSVSTRDRMRRSLIHLEAIESAFGLDIDDAMLNKVYRANPEGQTRYSPATRIGVTSAVVSGRQTQRTFRPASSSAPT